MTLNTLHLMCIITPMSTADNKTVDIIQMSMSAQISGCPTVQDYMDLHEENKNLREQIRTLTKHLDTRNGEIDKLKIDFATLLQENADLREENADLREENRKLHEEVARLTEEVRQLSEKNTNLTDRIAKMERDAKAEKIKTHKQLIYAVVQDLNHEHNLKDKYKKDTAMRDDIHDIIGERNKGAHYIKYKYPRSKKVDSKDVIGYKIHKFVEYFENCDPYLRKLLDNADHEDACTEIVDFCKREGLNVYDPANISSDVRDDIDSCWEL